MATITIYWKGDAKGYPTANDITITGKMQSSNEIVWTRGQGIKSIERIWFTSNPNDSITEPVQQGDNWTAVDTVKGNDRLKYLIRATSSEGYGTTDSPDPEIRNDVEP